MNADFYCEEDWAIWRRFKSGETAASIAKSLDVGVNTILKIILLVEQTSGSSSLFWDWDGSYDSEGFPAMTPKENVKIPLNQKKLESFLRGCNE